MAIRNAIALLSALLLALLPACDTPPAPVPPTPDPTASQQPAALPDLDTISPILLDARGALPSGATAAELWETPHHSFNALPTPQRFTAVTYSQGTAFAGRLSLFLYAYPEELDAAWPLVLDLIPTPKEVSGLGDLAAINHTDLAFIRCAGLVHIKFATGNPAEIRSFAEMLDARLSPHLCLP